MSLLVRCETLWLLQIFLKTNGKQNSCLIVNERSSKENSIESLILAAFNHPQLALQLLLLQHRSCLKESSA